MELYKSKYQVIEYNENDRMLRKAWTTQTELMSEEDFKSEVLKIAECLESVKPYRMCDNTQNFTFPISPELQTWVNTQIFPRFIAAGLIRYALIVSEEFIAQISIEQTMEEGEGRKFTVQYFNSEESAKVWLLRR